MTRKQDQHLYVASGERNIHNGVVTYANVGMAKNILGRFQLNDYKKKQSGGKWILMKRVFA